MRPNGDEEILLRLRRSKKAIRVCKAELEGKLI